MPRKPTAPSLRTLERANQRTRPGSVLNSDVYGNAHSHGYKNYLESLPPYAVKHETAFNIYSVKVHNADYCPSVHEPYMFGQVKDD